MTLPIELYSNINELNEIKKLTQKQCLITKIFEKLEFIFKNKTLFCLQ